MIRLLLSAIINDLVGMPYEFDKGMKKDAVLQVNE